jgi:O-antigen ligase
LRDQIWAAWYQRLDDFWLIGAGAGSTFEVCINEIGCFNQAHNLYLQFFYEYGVFGFIGLLLLIVSVAYKTIKYPARSQPLGQLGLPLLVFAVITAVVNYHTVLGRPGIYWMVFWFPIGLILAVNTGYKAIENVEFKP